MGQVLETEDKVMKCFTHYHQGLFRAKNNEGFDEVIRVVKVSITEEMVLDRDFEP